MLAERPGASDSLWDRRNLALSAWCMIAAFGTYFCMYAFRKPFTAAAYADTTLWGIGFKTILVTAQVLGYTISKFVGIKVVAEMPPARRAACLVGLIGVAECALLLFALTPAPLNCLWLFVNGLPLGIVFGLVLGFLEGRRQTEALAAGLCVSFIVADGVTKSVGASFLAAGVSEYWMPFVSGLAFLLPLVLFAWMLTRIPAPSLADEAQRGQRTAMNRQERGQLFGRYALGLTLIVAVYFFCTILRSVRADFAPEIWTGLGVAAKPEVFAQSETAVALVIVLATGATAFVRDNRRAFFTGLGLGAFGIVLVGAALLGEAADLLTPLAFMVLHGVGLYLPYIIVHTTLFERLMAMTQERGNIGYLMYLADAFGYLGYVAVMLARNIVTPGEGFVGFFFVLSWVVVVGSLILLAPCWRYFATHPGAQRDHATAVTTILPSREHA